MQSFYRNSTLIPRRTVLSALFCLLACVSCSQEAPEATSKSESAPEPIRLNPEFVETGTAALSGENANSGAIELDGGVSDSDLFLTDDEQEHAAREEIASHDEPTDTDPKLYAEVAALISEARELLDAERAPDAAQRAWQAWKLNPTSPSQIADIAQLLIRTKKFGPAIVLLDEAEKEDRANHKARVLLAQACYQAAVAEDVPDKALRLLNRSSTTLLQLDQDGVLATYGRSGAQLLVATLTKRARLAASIGRDQEALDVIETLYQSGFSQLSSLLTDPDFDPIRRNPEFAARVEQLQDEVRRRMRPEIKRRISATEPFDFDFKLTDINGKDVALRDYIGKVVIVDFWGTWCGPCRMTVPHLAKLSREYEDDLEVIGIAYEKTLPGRGIANVKEFVRKYAVPYTCVIGDNATKKQVPDFRSFPTMLFLDRTGEVRLKLIGYHGYEQLDAVVDLLLDGSERL